MENEKTCEGWQPNETYKEDKEGFFNSTCSNCKFFIDNECELLWEYDDTEPNF